MKAAAGGLAAVVLLPVLLLGAASGAMQEAEAPASATPSAQRWSSDVPAEMDRLYTAAATRFGLPSGLLAAVGKLECDHACDVRCAAPNRAGAVGPMQFLPATFARWSWASGSAAPSILDPADAVFAAAAKLAADGAAAPDPTAALLAYNHSASYAAEAVAWAIAYGWRTDSRAALGHALLHHPDVSVRAGDAADIEHELVDTRVLSTLLALATRHHLGAVGPFTRHAYFVHNTFRPSNHIFGRAVDIGAVDGSAVRAANAAARQVVEDALTLPDDIRPTEVLSPWRLTIGTATSGTDADHADHAHLGFDAPNARS